MKKRLLLTVALLALLFVTALGAYLIITITGNVQVEESITITPDSFVMVLYPGETQIQEIEVVNSSNIDVTIDIGLTVSSPEIIVTAPDSIKIKPSGTETFDIEIFAPLDVEPNDFTITLEISRG